jgi:DNA-binding NtrC family response regulator
MALVLVVEDERTTSALVQRFLEDDGYAVEAMSSAEECLSALTRSLPDVLCLDLTLPGMGGLEALEAIRARHLRLPIVILTADREVETVVAAMQRGAYDYLAKPVDRTKLLTTVRNAAERHRMSERLSQLEREMGGAGYAGITGASPAMQAVFRQLDRVAPSDVTVLIHGESGTGKELAARALHASSARKSQPFVALNCAAVPEALMESELFGHERGAFTGATAQRKGKFELADGGTLFLDEVADLPPALQAKLLRVLQERSFQRVGGSADVQPDFRLVAATHRNLAGEVEAGRFRSDLYFRLAVFELELPPLRDREGDALLLARRFVAEYAGGEQVELAPDAQRLIESYDWPGNVRELENAIQRAMVVRLTDAIAAADLPEKVRRAQPSPKVSMTIRHVDFPTLNMEDLGRRALEQALAQTRGNVSEAVRILGIGRTTAYRMMKRYGMR